MNIFKLELKRAIFNRRMLLVLILGIGIVLYFNIDNIFNEKSYYQYMNEYNLTDGTDISSLYGRWFGMSADELAIMFFYILPLLAVYPAGMIYFDDKKNGYLKNLYTQCSKIKCLFNKYFATFISGGVAVTTPLVFSFLLAALYSPARIPDSIGHYGILETNLWGDLFYQYPLLYTIAYLLLDFIYSGLFACLAMSLSNILSHKFTVFMSSFIFVVVLDFVCHQINMQGLEPDLFLSPAQFVQPIGMGVAILGLVLFLFSFLVFIIGGLKSETY